MNKLLLGCFRSPVKAFPARSQKTTDRLSTLNCSAANLLARANRTTSLLQLNRFVKVHAEVAISLLQAATFISNPFTKCALVYSYCIIIDAGCSMFSVVHYDFLFHDFLFTE